MGAKRTTIIGIVCGIVCAVCVFAYAASVRAEASAARSEALARYGGEQVEVCVAQNDIAPGEMVKASDVTTKLWVSDLLPEGAIKQTSEVVGKTASSTILKGEVILSGRFKNEASLVDVPAGFTAVSVPAKNVQAVGGSLVAGMYVDVYATGNTTTKRLISNVLVLATSVTSNESSSSSKVEVEWITIAAPPEYVEQLVAAAEQSQLYFTLPNNTEKTNDTTAGTSSDSGSSNKK